MNARRSRKPAAHPIMQHPLMQRNITDDELSEILATAETRGDRHTIREAKRALQGDMPALIACMMILGR